MIRLKEHTIIISCLKGFSSSHAIQAAFFASNIFYSSIQPKTTKFDYIEAKTTLGGGLYSIYDTNSVIFLVIQNMQCSTATCDLTQPKDNAAKLKAEVFLIRLN